eukprot:2392218-Amphidinium_carterae.1
MFSSLDSQPYLNMIALSSVHLVQLPVLFLLDLKLLLQSVGYFVLLSDAFFHLLAVTLPAPPLLEVVLQARFSASSMLNCLFPLRLFVHGSLHLLWLSCIEQGLPNGCIETAYSGCKPFTL